MTSATVIGGGVIGSACALALQGRGIATRLVDPDPEWRGASRGNAGHIAADESAPLASRASLRALPRSLFSRGGPAAFPLRDLAAWLPFGLRLIAASKPARFEAGKRALSALLGEAMPAWHRLAAEIDAPGLLRDRGHFILWESEKSAGAGRAALTAEGTAWRAPLSSESAELEGLVRPPVAIAHIAGTGQIRDLDALAAALMARFAVLGGIRIEGRGTVNDAETDIVIVAAGPASGELLRPLGHRVPLITERGYHIQASGEGWPQDLPSLFFANRSLFVTRFRGGLRATSFTEFGRASSPPDPRKWARLRAHARELGLPFAEPLAEWMGARPTLPDYLPAIGRSRRSPRLLYAFGHQHLGLTLAAATGEAVAALATGEAPAVDLAPFDLERFGGR